ncbi:Ger(x)C family spore germination protein [Paenibacillus filicis]|uniref:Ger(X)C family spore germination protein n=1 Tax=Paenibacillus filicis TaxID=669464 RepID=A0ABU9DVC1_9BACL
MRSLRCLPLLCCLILMLTGCGYKDIDKRFFVVSIGLDKPQTDGKKIGVLLKLAVPSADSRAGKSAFMIVREDGDSIAEAVRLLKSQVDKELDFSHAKMIVVGEAIASTSIREWIDWLIRRRDIQMIAWMGIGRPDAASVLSTSPVSERLPSNTLFLTFGETGTETSYVVSEYLFDFRKRLYERGLDPILPIIESSSDGKLFRVNQAAVFDKNRQKLVLSAEETRMYNILSNRAERAESQVSTRKNRFYVDIDVARTRYRFGQADAPKPQIIVEMDLEGTIEEAQTPLSSEKLDLYRKDAEASIRKEALHLLKLLQKEGLDPLGLGLMYRGRSFSPQDWSNWQAIYPVVDFDVRVHVTLQGTGSLR